jgi:hypothetical protein
VIKLTNRKSIDSGDGFTLLNQKPQNPKVILATDYIKSIIKKPEINVPQSSKQSVGVVIPRMNVH